MNAYIKNKRNKIGMYVEESHHKQFINTDQRGFYRNDR